MTPAEKILRRFENNKLVSFAIVIGVVVIALSSFTEALQKLGALLFRHSKPNVTLAEANNWKKGPPPIEEPYRPLPPKLQQRFDQESENLLKAGFVIAPSNLTTYRVEEPTTIKVMVPVTETLRYAIVACGNASINGLRGALFDEQGNLLDSDEGDRKISLKQSSDYTGTIECFIEVKDVDAVGQINTAIARRAPKEQHNSESSGVEPTFKMEGSPPTDSPERKEK